ncbi:MAG: LamG-like jellyroll fold domain-containing protein, partial [Bacteriovoracia bacterium]
MFSNKAYFTLRSNPNPTLNDPCRVASAIPITDGISGVLVNEGTEPDKQDARWESCRARRGSFGLENLTPGGHTITVWFKDLAGNVTPVSSDLVVNFIDGALPAANAVWPLDKSQSVSKYAVDVIDRNVHDLLMTNVDTPLNPSASYLTAGASVVKEGLNLASTSSDNGSFLSTPVTTLLTPVNYMSVGGWFYLTAGDAGTKVLIDTHRTVSTGLTGRHGYKLFVSGGSLRFLTELNIAGQRTVTHPMGSITTGWNHVLGVFTGTKLALFVNGAEVSSQTVSERDFVQYDDGGAGSNTEDARTDFRVGAESEVNTNPTSFFGAAVDELGLWGFDLSGSQVLAVYNAPATQSHFYDPLPAPANVENAFIYHYDNFGSRARMTVLSCENMPYILVQDQGAPVPAGDDVDWRQCNTIPGAILSKKLSLAVGGLPSYVDVYAKNADGVVSTVAGRKEILPVAYDYDLVLPITYFSFNDNQRTTLDNDFIIRNSASLSNAPARVANNDGHEYLFNGLNTPAQGINVGNRRIYDLREGISLAVWVDITNGDGSTRRIVSRDSTVDETALYLEGGALTFRVNIPSLNNLIRSTVSVDASYATANISTGRHFVVGTYDGLFVRLYLDSMLVAETNVRYRNYDATSVKTRIDMDSIQGFRLGAASTFASINGAVDEFMVFDRVLTEGELVSWYKRYKHVISTPDATPPAASRPLAVVPSAAGADVNDRPVYTIGDCTDIAGVFVSLSSTPPSEFDAGWQYCQTHEGYITGPVLNPGANTVYFFYKDQFGNVTLAGDTVPVNYNPPARPNPVAYWTMDDDSVLGQRIYEPVNQLHANLYGILPADFVAAGVATGVQLNGTRKYIEVNHSPIIKPTQELSVSFWMNVPVANEARSNKTVLGTRASAEGYMFRWTCNTVGTGFDAANTSCTSSPSNNSPTNEFFEFVLRLDDGSDQVLDVPQSMIGTGPMHIVGTYDGRFLKLYRNGVLLRTKDLKVDREIFYNTTSNTSLVIGARVGAYEKPAGEYFPGVVDEVAIFDKALTQAHVTELNGYITTDTRIFDPGRALLTVVPNRARIYEPGLKTYGSRLRLTM